MVLSEFRDGNVSANFDLLRPFQRALELVPDGMDKVSLRSYAAGYQSKFADFGRNKVVC